MFAGLTRRVTGKVQATRSLYEFVRHLRNWPAVWQAYRAGGPIPSPLLLRNGVRIEFGPTDDVIQVFREVFVRRCYTPSWFYRPRAGDVVLDLGANIGVFSLAVATRGARCHSFEPASATRARLARNVEVNGLSGSIRIHPLAVAGCSGTLELRSGASSIHTSAFGNELVTGMTFETVPVVGLAEAIQLTGERTIDLLKVDVEGAEKELFENASPEVLAGVRRVVLEFHDHFRPGARAAAERSLTAAGLRVLQIQTDTPNSLGGLLYAGRE